MLLAFHSRLPIRNWMSSSYPKWGCRVCPPNSVNFYSIDLIFTYVLENWFCYKINLCKRIISNFWKWKNRSDKSLSAAKTVRVTSKLLSDKVFYGSLRFEQDITRVCPPKIDGDMSVQKKGAISVYRNSPMPK